MRIVLDTNVLISGVFFGGIPGEILEAWSEGMVGLVLSPSIVDEYRRVGEELEDRYGDLGFSDVLSVIVSNSEIVNAADLETEITRDPDDDKFLACASSAGARVVVSGDDDLLSISPWKGIRVLAPRVFVDEFLS